MSAIRKAGVAFYPGVGVSPDLTGLASTISLKYKMRGDTVFTTSTAAFTEENPGTYTTPLTLSIVGDYIVIIESTDPKIENLEGNVIVTSASIDDVNNAVTALQSDMTAVKTQVDLLDEASVNNLSASLAGVSDTVNNINKLMNDSSNNFNLLYYSSTPVVTGDVIQGANGETANVTSVTYLPATATHPALQQIYFDTISGGASDFGADVSIVGNSNQQNQTYGFNTGNPLNSVLEFTSAINDALTTGTSSLSVLSGYTDNLELMLEGKAYTDTTGAAVLAADSYGLSEIYNAISAQGGDTTLINNLQVSIDSFKLSVETKIDANTVLLNTLTSKVDAAKLVVDANKLTLEDAGFGLSALSTQLTTINNNLSTAGSNTDVLAVLNDATNGLVALRDSLMTKLNLMDVKLDGIAASNSSRIFI